MMTGGESGGQEIVTRFAPSPTGGLHLGHAYSAIQAHDFARARGGRFLVRIEDIDAARCRAEHVVAIRDDLTWLGLEWDGWSVQSRRLPLYAEALDRLEAMGVIYRCFCTRAEVAREVAASAQAPHGADGPLYPGTCRRLSSAEREARMGEPHSWRLDAAAAIERMGPLVWDDGSAGTIPVEIGALGDLVVKGRAAPVSYHLASVVDDAAQGVSDVVRGRDIFASTHAQRLLQALLGLPTPRYHHHALVTDTGGTRLAKRTRAPTLAARRERGEDGHALAAMLREGRPPTGFGLASD